MSRGNLIRNANLRFVNDCLTFSHVLLKEVTKFLNVFLEHAIFEINGKSFLQDEIGIIVNKSLVAQKGRLKIRR